jgi:protein subunit release factor B
MIDFISSPEEKNHGSMKDGSSRHPEKDIEEKFIRSPGRGGQKVNKTSSCVYLDIPQD